MLMVKRSTISDFKVKFDVKEIVIFLKKTPQWRHSIQALSLAAIKCQQR